MLHGAVTSGPTPSPASIGSETIHGALEDVLTAEYDNIK